MRPSRRKHSGSLSPSERKVPIYGGETGRAQLRRKLDKEWEFMAKRGGNDPWIIGLGAIVVGGLLYYSYAGKGKDNALLIPDALENRIDRVIDTLNRAFGQRWVNAGISALQAHIVRTMPGVAGLVNAVYRAELQYRQYANAGAAKKQAALGYAGSRA